MIAKVSSAVVSMLKLALRDQFHLLNLNVPPWGLWRQTMEVNLSVPSAHSAQILQDAFHAVAAVPFGTTRKRMAQVVSTAQNLFFVNQVKKFCFSIFHLDNYKRRF